MNRSFLYQKIQREGKTTRNVVVNFDWETGTARYRNFDDQKPPVPLEEGTFDPLSVLYAARTCKFDQGGKIEIPVTDGKKCIMGRAGIVGRETVETATGTYDTFLLEPVMDEIGGVFEKAEGSGIKIWMTTDHRRLPVKMESEVAVGNFTGELVGISDGGSKKLAEIGLEPAIR